MGRQWYVYIVGALLYASAMWLGKFWLFLVGTAFIIGAVIIGEVDGKAASKAAREAQERRQ